MTNIFRTIALLVLLLGGNVAFSDEGVELSVPPGEVQVLEAHQTKSSGHLSMSITMLKASSGATWAPYAYIGFIDHDEQNSFRLFVSENNQKPDGLIAGYEYFQDGKAVKRVGLIHGIPVGVKVDFSVSWDENGTFTFSVLDGEKRSLTTHLRNVSQTLSVSGAHVVFR